MPGHNEDFMGNFRGKCKDPNCDCTEYYKTDSNACGMCGCFPGKHEMLTLGMTGNASNVQALISLPDAVNAAVAQMTPSKIIEVDVETGGLSIMKKKKLDFDESAKLEAHRPLEGDSEDIDDPTADPDYIPETDEPTKNEELVPVTTSRNAAGSTTEFSASAVQAGFLSVDLKLKINERGIFGNEAAFMAEAGSYLLSLSKKEKPTCEELTIFCSKMVEFFPDLKSKVGKCAWSAFKSSLGRHLVQRRFRAKNKKPSPPGRKVLKSCAVVPPAAKPGNIGDNLAALKMVSKDSPSSEVLPLIKETCAARREALATVDSSKSPSEILEIWPHLAVADWLIYDFYCFQNLDENFDKSVEDFLRRLVKVTFETEDESGYAMSVWAMVKKLGHKQPKNSASVVTIIEPLGNLAILQPIKGESPRLVLSVGTSGLSQTYVLFDGVTLELLEPTVQRAIVLLMAAYYVFDTKYPDPYSNFLTVLDSECLKKPNAVKPYQRTLFRFVRDLQNVSL